MKITEKMVEKALMKTAVDFDKYGCLLYIIPETSFDKIAEMLNEMIGGK